MRPADLVLAVRARRSAAADEGASKGEWRLVVATDVMVEGLAATNPLISGVVLHPLAGAGSVSSVARVADAAARVELGPDGLLWCTSAGDGARVSLLAPVDLTRCNPIGFPHGATFGTVRLDRLLTSALSTADGERAHIARRATAVSCVAPPRYVPVELATTLVEFAAMGAPLTRGEIPEDVRSLVSEELTNLIDLTTAADLRDPRMRELHSVEVRRIALTEHSPRGRWARIGVLSGAQVQTTPAISVLLPSNRAHDVVEAARQIARQRGVTIQLVVGLHGAAMPSHLDDEIQSVYPGDLVIERLPDDYTLGEVLQSLTRRADHSLVSKWDDDDWYDPEHLADLVLAREYSGAALVAKAAEFVFLEDLDLTVRRYATGSESTSTTMAGGTLLVGADELRHVGWAPVPRRVDRRLIEDLAVCGLGSYRTHGFGYVLRRRGARLDTHTWRVADTYFLRHSVDQRPGLDLQFAGFEPSRAPASSA